MYPTIFNQSLLSIASITLIFLLKLFHYTISLLLIFLIHSFSYSSSIQILLSSIPKTIQPNYLQTTPIHFHLYHNPPQYTLIHFPRESKSKKKKPQSSSNSLLPLLPLNSGNAQKIANSFSSPYSLSTVERTRSNKRITG